MVVNTSPPNVYGGYAHDATVALARWQQNDETVTRVIWVLDFFFFDDVSPSF